MTKKKRREKQAPQGEGGPVPAPVPEAAPEVEAQIEPPEPPDPAQLTRQRDDLTARLQRVSADYLNYQKRVQRDIDEIRRFGITDLVRALLDVLDDLERAIAHAGENHTDDEALLAGTKLIRDKALDVLKRFGVEPIEAAGRPFDPARHEAIARVSSADVEPMTVLTETQKGYILSGRTIRPSKVVVAVAPPADTQTDGDDEAVTDQEGRTDADV